jgi:hypothetical protein
MGMNLYLLTQTVNNDYDTFDSAVVAAETEEEARLIHPRGDSEYDETMKDWFYSAIRVNNFIVRVYEGKYGSWAPIDKVEVTYLGTAKPDTKEGVICASFNAG